MAALKESRHFFILQIVKKHDSSIKKSLFFCEQTNTYKLMKTATGSCLCKFYEDSEKLLRTY